MKALKDAIKNSEDTDAANQMKLLKKENEDLQESVRTLEGEKEYLQTAIQRSEEKYQAEKSENDTLRENIKSSEEKYKAEIAALKAKLPPGRNFQPPLKRRKSPEQSCKTREGEGEKADKTPKQRACSRSPSRRTSISRPQEADNTSDRRARFKLLTGHEAEGDWGCSR